jgi:hypothetical protein
MLQNGPLLKAMLLRSAWRLVKEGLTPFQAQAPVTVLLELVENMRSFSLPSVPMHLDNQEVQVKEA